MSQKSYKDQLKKADVLLGCIAKTEGMLNQSLWEWDKAIKQCPELMKETEDDIKKILYPVGQDIIMTCKNLREVDKEKITEMINILSQLAKQSSVTSDTTWNTYYEKGKSDATVNIGVTNKDYGVHNDFDNQLKMIGSIVDVVEGISTYARLIKSVYSKYEFDIKQEQFMKQFTDKLKQECFSPRKQDFSKIEIKLVTAKEDLVNLYLSLANTVNY